MQDYLIKPYILVFLMITILGCQNKDDQNNVGRIQPTIPCNIIRFDQELVSLNKDEVTADFDRLRTKYPAFSDLYFNQIVPVPEDMPLRDFISKTIADTLYLDLYSEVQKSYKDLTSLEREICQTLENYLKIFPGSNQSVPNIYTFISGFVYQCFLFSDENGEGIGLGLDLFLGDEFDYRSLNPTDPAFSDYLTRTYNREHVTRKIAEVLIEDKLPPPTKNDFMTYMIWGGKKLFILDKILDFKPDTIITEFTENQLNWSRENQAGIWNYFFEKNLFYATNPNLFNKLIAPAPGVPDMPPDAPGGVANYIGWLIVEAYMERNPNESIMDLIANMDAQDILDKSRYKPNR